METSWIESRDNKMDAIERTTFDKGEGSLTLFGVHAFNRGQKKQKRRVFFWQGLSDKKTAI